KSFEPLVPNFEFVEAGNVQALHDAFAETGQGKHGKGPVAAVIMELIQGEAGVRPLGADYVKKARQLCDEHHALLIIDEVQTGMGRTGSWFAFQREELSGGVTPDIVTFAKGVGGGFPMGGMISFGAELSALFTPGSHGSTFAGNPLGASAALATIGTIEEEGLVANADVRGRQLRDAISACGNKLFTSVRGSGLLDAIELAHPCAHAAMNWALEHGLIVNAVAPDALRLAPPLVVTEQDIDQAVSILAQIPCDLPND
ncbi:MAG TPA: acetylornithine transaminase, partial [Bifidobacterium sp.]|nr:acetylornithine transaminase [Bifidobacterium sp.]